MAEDVVPEAFAALAADAGFRLAPDELKRLHEGVVLLRAMIAGLPQDPALMDEPAFVHAVPGAVVTPGGTGSR